MSRPAHQVVELVHVQAAVDVVHDVVQERLPRPAPAPLRPAVDHLLHEDEVLLRQAPVRLRRHVDAVGADRVPEHPHRHLLVAPGGERGALAGARRVLQREAMGDALELVAEGAVAEVVTQAGEHDAEAVPLRDQQTVLLFLNAAHELAGSVGYAKGVLKPRVGCSRIDALESTELFQAAKPLELRSIDDSHQ